ncbi:MAG: tRNA(Met) cytidine acetyltransferase TmcA [Desulfurococcaceae archaeon]
MSSSSNDVHVPTSFNRFLSNYGKSVEELAASRHRALMVIAGSDPAALGTAISKAVTYYARRMRAREKGRRKGFVAQCLYVYHDEFPDAVNIKKIVEEALKKASKYVKCEFEIYEKSEKYLGQTKTILVMDLTHDLRPNDVGRLVGIVEGGGLIVLVVPRWDGWDNALTLFKTELTVPQFPKPRDVFIRWFKEKLLEHEGIGIYDLDEGKAIKHLKLRPSKAVEREKPRPPEEALFPHELYQLALTKDQVNVIKLIEWMVEKPQKGKKKVLVVTADRGRGKSCAIGIGAVGFIHALRKVKPKPRVIVTAPSPSNVQSFMMLASRALEKLGLKYQVIKRGGNVIELRGKDFSIEYWEPVSIPKIGADLAIIDEAAGIQTTMLFKIWESHRRLICATTIHGYEGAGRGFSVRFLGRLRTDPGTAIKEYEMVEPIRYGVGDPVERWQFDTLLLDAEPAKLDDDDRQDIAAGSLVYERLEPVELFSKEGERKLRELFGIYVLAHYRNEPNDLGMIADAPHHIVRAVSTQHGRTVCAVQAAIEGPIPREMVAELMKGGKIQGNIIPDRFLKHARLVEFGDLKGLRIVRIATHPEVQGRGIGSFALSKLYEEASREGYDWVGAGFGVNEELLRFWLKNGFLPIHISPDRNPVSGEYTLIVVRPITDVAKRLVERAASEFKLKLLFSLPTNYRDLEPEVARMLLSPPGDHQTVVPPLTSVQIDRLWTFCVGPMTFEAAADIMFLLTMDYWLRRDRSLQLSGEEELLLIAKVLQSRDWEEVSRILRKPAKALHKMMHEVACKMFHDLTGKNPEEYEPGVTL